MRASTPGLIAIAFAGTSCGPLKIVFPEDCTAGGCDTSASAAQAPASCSDLDAPTALNTWEVSTVEDVSSDLQTTCTAMDFAGWDLAQEWKVRFLGVSENLVVSPQNGNAWSTVFVDIADSVALLDGRDGTVLRTVDHTSPDGRAPSIGDADGDGDLDFATTSDNALDVLDLGSGGLLAIPFDRATSPIGTSAWTDANGDGILDVMLMDSAWTLAGRNIATWPGDEGYPPEGVFAADLDQDGIPEAITQRGRYPTDGSLGIEWALVSTTHGGRQFEGGPVEVDGEPAIWFSDGGSLLYLIDPEGEVLSSLEIAGKIAPVSIGDVDGDGKPEMCVIYHVASGDSWPPRMSIVSLDGRVLWTRKLSAGGGCTLADLDGDGRYEVVLSDSSLFILDGATGAVLAQTPDLSAALGSPVVADIDGDGSAEIVVSDGPVVYSYGAAAGRFARTRPVWNQRPYDITSVQDDGTLVSWPRPSWETYNAFRAQPAHDGEHPDLGVDVIDTCASDESTGAVGVLVRVANHGSTAAAAGAVLRLYTVRASGPVDLADTTLASGLAPGEAVEAWIWVDPSKLGARVAVDVTGMDADECDLVNNRKMVSF